MSAAPALCLALLGFAAASHADEPAARPHIIFILADDLGPGDLGFSGGHIAATPNIDRLAAEGIQLRNYYAASPICSPSRCGLITGMFPARWRINSYLQTRAGNRACEMADFLDPAAPALPRILKAAGYHTAHFGKWHLGGGRDVANPPKFAAYGYDEHAGTWESPEPDPDITATDWIWSDQDRVKRWQRTGFFVDKTLDFLSRHAPEPCFVNLWLDDVHTPWVPDAAAGKGASTVANLRRVAEEMDAQIGRLMDELQKRGLDRNTLVVFTSDNGPLPTLERARSVGLRGSKLSLYEGGVRLPFAARWPGHIPAHTIDGTSIVSGVDILPTIARIAGVTLAADLPLDGLDRSAVLLGQPAPTREKPLCFEYGRNETSFDYPKPANGARLIDRSPWLAIRDGNWKLLQNPDGTARELYDLAADPAESTNLAEKRPEVADRLSKQLLDWKHTLP